ncbi:ChbG/HpnK family deacetylase [Candidatus Pelagibacter sp.]|nr:ChbG/HpnK family deacetylase [Candidatus Pelagibacter sp.]
MNNTEFNNRHNSIFHKIYNILPKNILLKKLDGFFLRTNQLRKKALLNLIDPSHICLETIAQINELSNLGIKISHLDSHGHIHKFPIFSKAIGSIKNQTNIYKVRNYQNIFLKNKFLSPTFWLGPLFKKNIFGSLEIGVHPGSKENWRIKEFESCLIISEIMKKNKKYNLINWNHL